MKLTELARNCGLLAIGIAIGLMWEKRNAAPPDNHPSIPGESSRMTPAPPSHSIQSGSPQDAPPEAPQAPTLAPVLPAPAKTPSQPNLSQPHQPSDRAFVYNGYAVDDPVARVALSYVGVDPSANDYWIQAINDPSVPPEERKDLIEDLNETGFPDPHHPSPEDLPLIMNRMHLIEDIAPFAMDQVNADAFQEAYKDLVTMSTGQAPD